MQIKKGCDFKKIDEQAGVFDVISMISLLIACLVFVTYLSGCMPLTGVKKINAWGLEIESNAGFDVSAGVMQYDHALDRKGYSVESETPAKY